MSASRKDSPRPAGRRRRAPEDRRQDIVQAAFALFREAGYAATRMEDVARRAGVAKGTVYLYFTDKPALFEAVVEAVILPMVERLHSLGRTAGGPPADRLRRLLEVAYDELVDTDRREIVRMVIAESGRSPAIAAFYHRAVVSRAKAALSAVVAEGIAEGTFADGPLARRPEVIIGPVLMAVIWRLVFEETEPLDRDSFLAAHLDMVVNGLDRR
jgi:AcrR family transcriptional regulator